MSAQVKGVTLYVSDFRRPLTERIAKDFFSDPSQTSVACVRTGPVVFDKVRLYHSLSIIHAWLVAWLASTSSAATSSVTRRRTGWRRCS